MSGFEHQDEFFTEPSRAAIVIAYAAFAICGGLVGFVIGLAW